MSQIVLLVETRSWDPKEIQIVRMPGKTESGNVFCVAQVADATCDGMMWRGKDSRERAEAYLATILVKMIAGHLLHPAILPAEGVPV